MIFFFRTIFEAIFVIWKKRKYKKVKELSRLKYDLESNNLVSEKPLSKISKLLITLFGTLGKNCYKKIHGFYVKTCYYGTFENSVLKSIFGFIGGIILSHLLFLYLLFIIKMKFSVVLCMTCVIGTFLMQGLAFSEQARCIILLVLPQLFTRQGRQVLLMYSFYLSSDPVTNTLKNGNIIAENIYCKQKLLSFQAQKYIDLVKNPINFLRDKLPDIKSAINELTGAMKVMLWTTSRLLFGMLDITDIAKEWLESVFNICSTKVGTPFQRCTQVFDDFLDDCLVQLSPQFNIVCTQAYVASNICYFVKVLDVMCSFVTFIDDSFHAKIQENMRKFTHLMKEMVYADVQFNHSYSFTGTQNDTIMMTVFEGYITDLQSISQYLIYAINLSNILVPFFSLYIFYHVFVFHSQYLNRKNYDNFYITEEFIKIDSYRSIRGLPSLLPLSKKESHKYIYLSDFNLLGKEKRKIFVSSIGMIIGTVQVGIFVFIDWVFYYLTTTVKSYDKYFYEFEDEFETMEVDVQGNTSMSRFLRKIIKSLEPDKQLISKDRCEIEGSRPNVFVEGQLVFLTLGILLLQIAEPYGLRTRQIIMKMYHPNVSLDRTVWLYNHILHNRKCILEELTTTLNARSYTHSDQSSSLKQLKKTLLIKLPWMSYFGVRRYSISTCTICNIQLLDEEIFRCVNELCNAIYCRECYQDESGVCVECFCPFTFYDEIYFMDISEETDSSDELVTLCTTFDNKDNRSDIEEAKPFPSGSINRKYSRQQHDKKKRRISTASTTTILELREHRASKKVIHDNHKIEKTKILSRHIRFMEFKEECTYEYKIKDHNRDSKFSSKEGTRTKETKALPLPPVDFVCGLSEHEDVINDLSEVNFSLESYYETSTESDKNIGLLSKLKSNVCNTDQCELDSNSDLGERNKGCKISDASESDSEFDFFSRQRAGI